MLHGDISPSPEADGVSGTPGHADAFATRGHSSQVTGQESTTLQGSEQPPGDTGSGRSSAPAPGNPQGQEP